MGKTETKHQVTSRPHPERSRRTRAGAAILALGFFLLGALPAAAQDLFPLQPHPEGVAWPTERWETGDLPEESAVEVKRQIDEAMALTREDVMGETRAIVVIHKGQLVAEAYADGFGPDTKQMSWSLAKSVTHGLVGRAVQLDLIEDIDAPMPTPFPAEDSRSQISWRDWLNMTDGLEYGELNEPRFLKNDVVQMMFGTGKADVAAYMARETGIAHEPGQVWNYSTGGYHLVGGAVMSVASRVEVDALACVAKADVSNGGLHNLDTDFEAAIEACEKDFPNVAFTKTLDRPKSTSYRAALDAPEKSSLLKDWQTTHFFAPLGMEAQPEFDPSGTYLGGSNIWASAHDFAKFGYLYLRDGVWEGERLLAEGWVDFARTPGPDQDIKVYGAGFWLALPEGEETTLPRAARTAPFDAFRANGSEGQTISIVPSRDLVIVRLGIMPNTNPNWNALFEWNQQMARAFPEVVIDNTGPDPLPTFSGQSYTIADPTKPLQGEE